MSQKVALVTGAMGGLGTAICQALSKQGFKVVANCLPDFPPRDEWLAEQKKAGFDFVAAEGDVSDYESCKAMVERIDYANDADGRGKPQVAITIHMRR